LRLPRLTFLIGGWSRSFGDMLIPPRTS
jgi:hypothetical protein